MYNEIMIKLLIFLLNLIGMQGVYIYGLDITICDSPRLCAHEAGHRLDAKLGFPSQSLEFKEAVNDFPALVEMPNTCVIKSDYCFYSEAYANLYGSMRGNIDMMQDTFQEFYQ